VTNRLTPNLAFLADSVEGVPIHPTLPKTSMVIDGTRYFFNGWNQPWYADIATGKLFPLGSRAPTTFTVADDAGGTAFPAGTELFYYLVFRNDARGEETCPQLDADGVAGYAYTMIGTKDALITWDDPGDERWTTADIYRRFQNSDLIVRVASVPIADETYVDDTVDDDLDVTALYIARFRSDLPPKFLSASPHLGRILGVTGKDSLIYFSQRVRADGELVQVDFKPSSIVIVDPDDGLGENMALVAHYDTTILFKRYGIVLIEGDPANDSFAFRTLYSGRGILGPRCVVAVDGAYVVCDEQGMYGWLPSSEPRVLGARGGTMSPLAPLWKRINRGSHLNCHLRWRPEPGVVEAYFPIDVEPYARRGAVWNKEADRFDSLDDRISTATGDLEDGAGVLHDTFLGPLGLMWEREMTEAHGLESGDIAAQFLSAPGAISRIHCAAASFTSDPLPGPTGTFLERYDVDGELLDENVVFSNSGGDIDQLWWSPEAVAFSQTLDVGVMVSTAEFAKSDYETADRKFVPRVVVRFKPLDTIMGVSPTLSVYSAADERTYALRRTLDMTNVDGWSIVPCNDRFFHFNLKFEKRLATDRFEVQAISADLWAGRLRR
jgi:hypothetical protein